MSILNWYVLRGFLLAFFMAIGILTFAMLGARLGEVMEMLARGIPVKNFFLFIYYALPMVLI